jgi:hypothetical protein
MKPNASLLKTLLVAVSLGAAVPVAAQDDSPIATQKPGADQGASVAPGAKQEAEPKIDGIVLTRPKGGYLGLTLEGGGFKLSFYNAKKKPAKVDVARATARWPVHYSAFDERTVLNPNADGTALTSSKYVRPPYAFKLYLSLFGADGDNAVESYVIDFHM